MSRRPQKATLATIVALVFSLPATLHAQAADASDIEAALTAELGFLQPLAHEVQFSRTGSTFDYVEEGGQDLLFSFARLSADVTMGQRHTVTFLYQPLSLETAEVLRRDISVDEQLYPSGTAMVFRYDFPFYRVSYVYDLAEGVRDELSFGGSLQLRDARIEFATLAGEDLRTNRSVGPVPLLKFRARRGFDHGLFVGTEMDGFYAPVKYFNGGRSDVVGAILDASVRAGADLDNNVSGFVNLRYLGGGAEGTSSDDTGPGDGFNKNWLHFLTVSLGFILRV